MKVFFVNTVYGRGSTGRLVAEIGAALEARGDCYRVACGRGRVEDPTHCERVGNDWDLYCHAALSRLTDRSGFYSARATRRLIERIRAEQPDIIHLHNLHGYYLNLELFFDFLKCEYKGRIVWTLHDCWAFTGHCPYYSYAQCDKWRPGCGACTQKKEYPASLWVDASASNFLKKKELFCSVSDRLTVVPVSHWLEGEVKQSFLRDADCVCIRNGIDTERFRPCDSNVRERYGIGTRYMFLCVSDGWDRRKGFDHVLELSREMPADCVIVMVGLDPKQIETLPQNIIGMERTWNQQELIELYSAADCLFNPSSEETFGLVTAEAMACGTPAIVFNTTACPELVGSDACGLILEPGDSIRDRMDSLVISKRDKTDACVRRVREQFDLNRMKASYLALYDKLLNG